MVLVNGLGSAWVLHLVVLLVGGLLAKRQRVKSFLIGYLTGWGGRVPNGMEIMSRRVGIINMTHIATLVEARDQGKNGQR